MASHHGRPTSDGTPQTADPAFQKEVERLEMLMNAADQRRLAGREHQRDVLARIAELEKQATLQSKASPQLSTTLQDDYPAPRKHVRFDLPPQILQRTPEPDSAVFRDMAKMERYLHEDARVPRTTIRPPDMAMIRKPGTPGLNGKRPDGPRHWKQFHKPFKGPSKSPPTLEEWAALLPGIRPQGSPDSGPGLKDYMTLVQINLKQSPLRVALLARHVAALPEPWDVICIQDPPPDLAWRVLAGPLNGYEFYSFCEVDLSKFEDPKYRKADSSSPFLTDNVVSRVAFLVSKQIPLADVAFERYEGAPHLGAFLTIQTLELGPIKICNFYNRRQELDIKALEETCGGPNHIFMGDLNSHHPLWGGAAVRRGDASGIALAQWSATKSMTCINKPGQLTYSRSADDTTNSSTIDLTFLGSDLHRYFLDWDILDVEGFESDHRVIQTTLSTSCNAVTKFHRLWKQVDQPKFKRKLGQALGRLGMPPLRTKIDIDNRLDTVLPIYQTALEESGHGRRTEKFIAQLVPKIRKKVEEDPDARANPRHPLHKLDPIAMAEVLADRIRRCPRGKGGKNRAMDEVMAKLKKSTVWQLAKTSKRWATPRGSPGMPNLDGGPEGQQTPDQKADVIHDTCWGASPSADEVPPDILLPPDPSLRDPSLRDPSLRDPEPEPPPEQRHAHHAHTSAPDLPLPDRQAPSDDDTAADADVPQQRSPPLSAPSSDHRPDAARPSLKSEPKLRDGEVANIIRNLPTNKASGPDAVPNEAFKVTRKASLPILEHIFEACIRLRHHPSTFHVSTTVMLKKLGKDSYTKPTNWRPIALLSCLGKMLDRLLGQRITELVAMHKLLPEHQFAGPGGSTEAALEHFKAFVYRAWGPSSIRPKPTRKGFAGLVVTVMGTDIAGAYNALLRDKIIAALIDMGMPRWIVEMCHSFLYYRPTQIVLPGHVSKLYHTNRGVPQGSPLSLILFLIAVAALLKALERKNILCGSRQQDWIPAIFTAFAFVDDHYLAVASHTYETNCKALKKLHGVLMEWAGENGLAFGADKYRVMHLEAPWIPEAKGCARDGYDAKGRCLLRPEIDGLGPRAVPPDEDYMDILGVRFHYKMDWTHHVEKIATKVTKEFNQLCGIGGVHWGISMYNLRQLYVGKFRSSIQYASGVWFVPDHGFSSDLVDRLEKLQKTCLVRVSGAWKNTGYEMLLKELNIEKLAVYLRRTAVAYRARALTTPHGNRLGHFVNESLQLVDKPREYIHLHPFHKLYNEEAIGLVAAAEQELRMSDYSTPLNSISAIGGSNPPDSDPVALYAEGIKQQKRLKKKITQLATRWSKSESSRLWDKYRERRTQTRPAASKYAIFQEGWGNSSLSYYKNLNRAQSTMLMRCRTGYIGLKRKLYVMKKADTDLCDCKTGRHTVPHLFLFCPLLADARSELRQKLGHTNLNRLLGVDAAVAMEWAIRHFGLEQPTSSKPDSGVQPPQSGPNLLFEAG